MASEIDETTLETISLLEARLLRIEHHLYGHTTPQNKNTAARSLRELEHRFRKITQDVHVYNELLKIYKSYPDLFHSPNPSEPPSLLSPDAIRAIVLASAASYPATASSLTAINDTPIPDPALSAALVALIPRMKAVEATQLAQNAEIAALRAQSELVLRQWYERGVMGYSNFLAGVEDRMEVVERDIRRIERAQEEV
ncbi:putative nuclear distribution protein RO10 [Microdochium trichocladiopsis]|uniref:Nuclear distribution protein RO10 n=1 Tax=Microdochium trichocladiopsis TaxID=1682393 RepID=A0A9P8YDC7_9PEZI|nr:putative nuclear distribution protein RO10 [Microdochium trichocladiopsis]KAH7037263.1 putative nuclear distribution protein RO10 [Microdochium trichocladiopsis]